MKLISAVSIDKNRTIRDVMEILNKGTRLVVIIDNKGCITGSVSDGDVRRALLAGLNLDDHVSKAMNPKPIVALESENDIVIFELAKTHKIKEIIIVDLKNKPIGIKVAVAEPDNLNNKVVLMAGGLGSRLRPLTSVIPKPLLDVGEKPIIQTIIKKFSNFGFKDFIVCLNYKANMIKTFLGDGSEFNVNIEYVTEQNRRGTAGALDLLRDELDTPFFVMNADLLTNVNFKSVLDFHMTDDADITMCVREYEFQVPYGVVERDLDHQVVSINEKPVHKFDVSAGIYLINPSILNFLPKGRYFDMPDLVRSALDRNKKVKIFPIAEYWLDIGKMDDYERANKDYVKHFSNA